MSQYELHYSKDGCHQKVVGDPDTCFYAAWKRQIGPPYEVIRVNTNEVLYAETDRVCACGSGHIMRGWRVCLSCAQARLQWPDGFSGDPPDFVGGDRCTPSWFPEWDLLLLHAEWT